MIGKERSEEAKAGAAPAGRGKEPGAVIGQEHDGRARLLLRLFWATLSVSACTFGGGLVIVMFIKKKFVDEYRWIDEREMLDFIAIAQSSPGVIAVNSAVLTGWHVAGPLGVAASLGGTILPPIAIICALSTFYEVFIANPYLSAFLAAARPAVCAVILDAASGLGAAVLKPQPGRSMAPSALVMLAAFVAAAVFKVDLVLIILAAALGGAAISLARSARARRRGPGEGGGQ